MAGRPLIFFGSPICVLKQAGAKKEKKDKTEKIPKAHLDSSTKIWLKHDSNNFCEGVQREFRSYICSMEVGYTPFK